MSFFSILPIGSLFLTLPDANSLSWAIPVALIPLIPVSFKELSAAQKGAVIVGTSISHYKVTEKIGEGGMGEVYRATDTKLNRDVALKILPEQFASDSQRMGRFQREAEVLASLVFSVSESGTPRDRELRESWKV